MEAPTRESVTTIGEDGSRRFLHPADARGRFNRWRRLAFVGLIAIYAALPWIQIGGNPAVFLNIPARRFHLFGLTFVAQDFWLTFFIITGLAFSLFYLTAFLGRVWCGWACPQTVFLDGVFRRIERWIEGDAPARRQLDEEPWTNRKIFKRVAKHSAFVVVAALIAHLFLAYFVSLPELYAMVLSSPLANWTVFLWAAALTGALYFNFSWFREQLCIIICPYGRLQSALIDEHSVVIGYDERRGEPRGKRSRVADLSSPRSDLKTSEQGDCVDCLRCVSVCPTGIDIRQGLQLECIACTACVDACDAIMDRLGQPRGLIRYDSLAGLNGNRTRWIRPRTVVYTAFLLAGMIAFALAASTVRPFKADVIRMAGPPYYQAEDLVRNHYQVRIINKTGEPATFSIELDAAAAGLTWLTAENPLIVPPQADRIIPVIASVPRTSFRQKFPISIRIRSASGSETARSVTFLGPET
jgi:cytochrome c oxidase accessory protein FixG